MSIDLIFRIAGVGIAIAIINSVLSRAGKEDIAHLVNIAGIVIILLMIVPIISDLFSSIKSIFGLY